MSNCLTIPNGGALLFQLGETATIWYHLSIPVVLDLGEPFLIKSLKRGRLTRVLVG